MPRFPPLVPLGALAVLALHLAVGLPRTLGSAARRVLDAAHWAGAGYAEVRRAALGSDYADAIAEIRRALPEREGYWLVDDGERDLPALYRARFELAPRPPRFAGFRGQLARAPRLRARLRRGPRWVVVAPGRGRPPRLLPVPDLIRELESRDAPL